MHALQTLAGLVVAVALDWSIYTHLSAYLRLGILGTPDATYSDVARGRSVAVIRTAAVVFSGGLGGLAFALGNGPLWLFACGLFLLAHSALYALLYKRHSGSA